MLSGKEVTYVDKNERMKEFINACKPIQDFLAKYYHPHAYAVVSTYDGEIVEGNIHFNVDFDKKAGEK